MSVQYIIDTSNIVII